ncbi:hypothetical protein K504DRAFT_532267 [Pleomassaria siparia CBS 279.74]|uniref:Uncharacterized protein n=1 Tax=Pleomassaria siparia CBS 279.74 TaxID=1314801 RepID=A0A6G1KGG0_9PLEO|nr:hypothetical protein K504DRAFT_532267 [Pleomassaria siparia CBS 279.74]
MSAHLPKRLHVASGAKPAVRSVRDSTQLAAHPLNQPSLQRIILPLPPSFPPMASSSFLLCMLFLFSALAHRETWQKALAKTEPEDDELNASSSTPRIAAGGSNRRCERAYPQHGQCY